MALGTSALICKVLVCVLMPGSIAKTLPLNFLLKPSVVKLISESGLICPIYFSGIEKLIFKGLILDRFAIRVEGVM
ncbi:hypothetical protein D3C85_1576980 [compost metagenome]